MSFFQGSFQVVDEHFQSDLHGVLFRCELDLCNAYIVLVHSEGEKRNAINISEGEKEKRINEAEGAAAQIELVSTATADSIKLVAEAIRQPGGNEALQLRIAQEYIKNFGHVLSKATSSVLPLNVAAIKGTFEGIGKITEGTNPGIGPEGK